MVHPLAIRKTINVVMLLSIFCFSYAGMASDSNDPKCKENLSNVIPFPGARQQSASEDSDAMFVPIKLLKRFSIIPVSPEKKLKTFQYSQPEDRMMWFRVEMTPEGRQGTMITVPLPQPDTKVVFTSLIEVESLMAHPTDRLSFHLTALLGIPFYIANFVADAIRQEYRPIAGVDSKLEWIQIVRRVLRENGKELAVLNQSGHDVFTKRSAEMFNY